MAELRRLTPRGDVFERYVFDEEERPGSELLRQALNGRLDVLDDVGVVVCSLQRRSKKILWHDSLLGLVQAAGFTGDHNSWSRFSMYFLPFGKLTNSSIIPQGVRKWAKVANLRLLDSHRLLGPRESARPRTGHRSSRI
jgi:hypothetical protein